MALPTLTHHWALDDGSGTTITDGEGVQNGTLEGTTTNVWNKSAQDGSSVLQFNGTDNRVDLTGVSHPSGDFSGFAVIWVNRSQFTDFRGIAGNRHNANGNLGWGVFLRATGIQFHVQDSVGGTNVQVNVPKMYEYPLIVQWGFRASDGAMFLRVNQKETTGTGGALDAGTTTHIGYFGAGSGTVDRYFSGWMADVGLSDGTFWSTSQRDDVYNALITRVNGSFSVSTPDTQLSITKFATAYDGETVARNVGALVYTPIMSSADYIFVAEPITRSTVEQSRAGRYNISSGTWDQDEQLEAAAHDSDAGHRQPSIGVDPNGTIVAHPERHSAAWNGKHTTSAHDLTTLANTTTPTGADLSANYRRFWQDTVNSKVFLSIRGNDGEGRFYEWDNTAKTWGVVGNSPINNYTPTTAFDYGNNFAVDSNGNIYLATGHRHSGSGNPRRMGGVMKSADGGTSWTDMEGTSITLPADETDQTQAFPLSTETEGTANSSHDLDQPVPFFFSDGTLGIVTGWRNEVENDNFESVWLAIWTGEYFTHHRLYSASAEDAAGVRIAFNDTTPVLLFISGPTDNVFYAMGLSKTAGTRYLLDDGTAVLTGGYPDPLAWSNHSTMRVLAASNEDPTLSEIWEFSLPSATSATGNRGGRLLALGVI